MPIRDTDIFHDHEDGQSVPPGSDGCAERRSTGFWTLDGALGGGLLPDHLVLIAGRAGVGASTLALNIAVNVAARASAGPTVAYASLQASAFELDSRVRRRSEPPGHGEARRRARRARATPAGLLRHIGLASRLDNAAVASLRDAGLRVMPERERRTGSLEDVLAFLDHVRHDAADTACPLALVVVDGLGLLDSETTRAGRTQRTALSRLRAFADRHGVPVVAVTSLRPGRPGLQAREPQPEDLAIGSRTIERCVDSLLLVDAPPLLRRPERPILVRNQGRNGASGSLDVMLTQLPGRLCYRQTPRQLEALLRFQAEHRPDRAA
jgi:hypothetical protein